jgi:hypothetical protein
VGGNQADVRSGLQSKGPDEHLAADRLLEAFRARVQPCATPGQPVYRIRNQEKLLALLAPHRDHSQ